MLLIIAKKIISSKVVKIVIVAVMGSLMLACSDADVDVDVDVEVEQDNEEQKIIEVNQDTDCKGLSLIVGQRISIDLYGNQDTGYEWKQVNLTKNMLQLDARKVENQQDNTIVKKVGLPSVTNFVYQAITEGDAKIYLIYQRRPLKQNYIVIDEVFLCEFTVKEN